MFFMLVAVLAQFMDQGVGGGEGGDRFGCEERGQTLLRIVVEAFDFALGLRRVGLRGCLCLVSGASPRASAQRRTLARSSPNWWRR